jgi:hypothetical protein
MTRIVGTGSTLSFVIADAFCCQRVEVAASTITVPSHEYRRSSAIDTCFPGLVGHSSMSIVSCAIVNLCFDSTPMDSLSLRFSSANSRQMLPYQTFFEASNLQRSIRKYSTQVLCLQHVVLRLSAEFVLVHALGLVHLKTTTRPLGWGYWW